MSDDLRLGIAIGLLIGALFDLAIVWACCRASSMTAHHEAIEARERRQWERAVESLRSMS